MFYLTTNSTHFETRTSSTGMIHTQKIKIESKSKNQKTHKINKQNHPYLVYMYIE